MGWEWDVIACVISELWLTKFPMIFQQILCSLAIGQRAGWLGGWRECWPQNTRRHCYNPKKIFQTPRYINIVFFYFKKTFLFQYIIIYLWHKSRTSAIKVPIYDIKEKFDKSMIETHLKVRRLRQWLRWIFFYQRFTTLGTPSKGILKVGWTHSRLSTLLIS